MLLEEFLIVKEERKMRLMSRKGGFGKFLAGIGIGAGLGLLLSPKSGEENRKDLKDKINQLIEEAKKVDMNDVRDEFLDKIDELRTEVKDLDKEKVLSLAKEKGEQIKDKASELVSLAKEKGTPVLENAANDLRLKAIDVTKEVLKKLEKKDK